MVDRINPSAEQQTLTPQEAIDLAVQHHTSGDLSEAENLYQQVLQADPNQPVALHFLGVIAHQRGDNDRAVELITKALEFKSDYSEAHSTLGIVLMKLGQLKNAVVSYRKAIAFNVNNAEAHGNLGVALDELGQLAEGITSYEKAIALKPDFAEAHSNLGNAFKKLHRLDEAIMCYRNAIEKNPRYAEAYNNLGNAFLELGKLDEAVSSYKKSIEIKSDYAEAHGNLGAAFMELGQVDEAVYRLQKSIEIKSDLPSAHYNLHALLLNPDDMTPSIQCLEKIVNWEPHESKSGFPDPVKQHQDYSVPLQISFMLGMLLEFSGRSQEALNHFDNVEKGTNTDRANLHAWRYIKSVNKEMPRIIGTSIDTFKLGIEAAVNDGLVMEFGVRFGTSIRQIASLVKQEVHGFDSFEGLPDAWNDLPKGAFSTNNVIPSVPQNVILYKGWFEETLPSFIKKFQEPVRFMNIDCDIYSSTKTVLELFSNQIIPGTVIVFDEYIGNESWREDEFKAFQESVQKYNWNYEYLCFSFMTKQVAVRIK